MDNYLDSGQLEGRHPSTVAIARFFLFGAEARAHRDFNTELNRVVAAVLAELPDSPFLTKGLDHLLSATDCFRRATLHAKQEAFENNAPETRAALEKIYGPELEKFATGGIVTTQVYIGQDVPETVVPLKKQKDHE